MPTLALALVQMLALTPTLTLTLVLVSDPTLALALALVFVRGRCLPGRARVCGKPREPPGERAGLGGGATEETAGEREGEGERLRVFRV